MSRIHKLPDHLVNQIAAGEVVERPSAVVKELLENALDAGATSVDVVLELGGRRLVQVSDDGCGMTAEETRQALERHATSKIAAQEDLTRISTLGFRGEALPAIASVARMELTSAAADGDAVVLRVEGGAVVRDAPGTRARGTSVEVRDLFYNTPARAKFLRTVATELGRSTEAVHACALARPDVRFRLQHDGRELLLAPVTRDARERIRQIFGADLAEGLLAVTAGEAPLALRGFVSRPGFSRGSRATQFVFVNGRFVQDRTLSHAVQQACAEHFPRGRYPALFLYLEIPADQVDVNVHPAKREVRFRTPGAVHDLLRRGLAAALGTGRPAQPAAAAEPRVGWSRAAVEDALEAHEVREPVRWNAVTPPAGRGAADDAARRLPGTAGGPRLLGQLRDTYLVLEEEEGLLLVDQHAAHERILYDRYRDELARRQVPVQSLLFPVNVEVPPARAARFEPMVERLAALGFAVERFGDSAFLVRAVPAVAAGVDPARLLGDLVDQLGSEGLTEDAVADLEHRVAALAACHAAVRAGMRLEPERAGHIVDTLLEGGHAPTCPHGRPALLRYPLPDLEKAFLRA